MASGDNPNYDIGMALGGMYGPNPYTQFNGRLPGPTYNGPVTDAYGRPIQPPPGMTLNSNPVAPAPAPAPARQQPQGMTSNQALAFGGMLGGGGVQGSGMGTQNGQATLDTYNQLMGGQGQTNPNDPARIQYIMSGGKTPPPNPMAAGGAGAGAAGGAAAAQPFGAGSYQDALNLLANPGKPTVVGATVPESQPMSGQPSVLNQFLQTRQGGTGAGNYSNQGFFDTLNRLRSSGLAANSGNVPQSTSLTPQIRGMPG